MLSQDVVLKGLIKNWFPIITFVSMLYDVKESDNDSKNYHHVIIVFQNILSLSLSLYLSLSLQHISTELFKITLNL